MKTSANTECAVEVALEVLGGKWRVVLLAHIKEAPRRYAATPSCGGSFHG